MIFLWNDDFEEDPTLCLNLVNKHYFREESEEEDMSEDKRVILSIMSEREGECVYLWDDCMMKFPSHDQVSFVSL